MKKLFYLLSLAALVFTLPSCSGDDYDEPELNLDKSELAFANTGGSETITIESNKEAIEAYTPEEWLKAEVKGTQMTVTAKVNESGMDRKGTVLVNAVGATKVVVVKQAAGAAYLFVNKSEKSIACEAAEIRVDFQTNAKTVQVSADNDWMVVDYAPGYKFFEVAVAANEDMNMREGVITVKADDQAKQFVVKQQGANMIVFPLVGEKTSLNDVKVAEYPKGYCILQEIKPGYFNKNAGLVYHTYSKLMPQLAYIWDDGKAAVYDKAQTMIIHPDAKSVIESDAFVAKMKEGGINPENYEEGTVVEGEKEYETRTYKGENLTMVATFVEGQGALLDFTLSFEQPEEMPTWSELPIKEEIGWCHFADENVHGKKLDEIKTLLADKAGYEYSEEDSTPEKDFYYWNVKNQDDRFAFNIWTESENAAFKDECSTVQLWARANYCFWQQGEKFNLTNEFLALMEKEGYTFLAENKGFQIFTNTEEKIAVAAHAGNFKGLEEYNPVCGLQAFRIDTSKNGSSYTTESYSVDGKEYTIIKRENKLVDEIMKHLVK